MICLICMILCDDKANLESYVIPCDDLTFHKLFMWHQKLSEHDADYEWKERKEKISRW